MLLAFAFQGHTVVLHIKERTELVLKQATLLGLVLWCEGIVWQCGGVYLAHFLYAFITYSIS